MSAAGPVEVSPAPVIDTILLTPWPMLLMTAHNIIEYLYERFLWFSGILPSEKLENDVFYYDNDSDIKYV